MCWSTDSGEIFNPVVHDAALPEPVCQASLCAARGAGGSPAPVLFSNPGSRAGRECMTVRLSRDECRTWPLARPVHDGPSGYSDLCVTSGGTVLCLYEGGDKDYREGIALARFELQWLTGGDPLPPSS